ncbi:MAG: hypothetical protein AUJ02_12385 [Chloroflexi bacterium 13_1_40CM_3_65_12]|nr:MAG: hypothetical protein AUH40_08750 [Chloroflexi bacterium 13_1_40CM_65_17]OLC48680.1 MAG: hypothetical protein AUH82_02380 [Chloroflexi bacterium 13_1_40CM_4_65_13]OLD22959.1 MAG: hypothetical protein AUJ02_12385 [Chloroflexi bacterium 13_1_40CM_3_65_12]OLD50984.1 MAG: hypothetical protein AUI42_00745 [Actinobacteria bacterium 13_1_40CM_2_65_8]
MSVAVEGPVLENKLLGPVPKVIAVRIEPIAKRVRAFVGGVAIADSCRVMMMFETARLCVYYFPIEDVRTDLLVATSNVVRSVAKGDATYYSVAVDGKTVENAAWRYLDPPAGCPDLTGFIAFHWKLMDSWFEEDDEVFVHARDPYHRIDVLNSSREVRVVVGGQVVAVTSRARFLFETGLPVRYYIPKEDVRTDLLQPSQTKTACAYKGPTSLYWQATPADGTTCDVAWCYENPPREVATIAGMVAFFNERVDAIYVDGKEMPRTQTPWSL